MLEVLHVAGDQRRAMGAEDGGDYAAGLQRLQQLQQGRLVLSHPADSSHELIAAFALTFARWPSSRAVPPLKEGAAQLSDCGMSEIRNGRSSGAFWVYLGVAAIGLIGTGYFNIVGFTNPSGSFFAAWFANPSVTSLSIDLLATASAASIFIILEGRRLGIRWYWLYVLGSFVTAVAFTFPLFLAIRERRLAGLS